MTSRAEYYRTARLAAARLGEQPRLRWPSGSHQQWRAERNRLVLLANELRAARVQARALERDQRERERRMAAEEAERRAEAEAQHARALSRLVPASIVIVAADILEFVWDPSAYVFLGMPVPTPEQLRAYLEPYMVAGVRYRFALRQRFRPANDGEFRVGLAVEDITPLRRSVSVWLGVRMNPWYSLHYILTQLVGNEYDEETVGIQLIGAVNENPELVGVRTTLTDTNCAIKIVEKYIRTDKNSVTIKKKIAKLNAQYLESGIDNVGLQALANATQMRLVVSDVLGMTWQKFDVLTKHGEPIKGNCSRTIYMLAHNNHVEEEQEAGHWDDDAVNSKEENVKDVSKLRRIFRDDLNLKGKPIEFHDKSELVALAGRLENIDAKALISKGEMVALVNATHIHKVKFTEYEKYPQAFTAGGVGKLKFLAQHPRFQNTPKPTKFLQIARDADVSGFYMRTGPSSKDHAKYDMNSAYKSFKSSGLFRGFPNLSACYSVNKPFSEFSKDLTPLSQGLLYIEFPKLTLEYLKKGGQIHFEGSGWYPVEIVQAIWAGFIQQAKPEEDSVQGSSPDQLKDFQTSLSGLRLLANHTGDSVQGSSPEPNRTKSEPTHDFQVKFYAYASDSFDVDFSDFTNDQFREFIGKCGQSKHTSQWKTTDPIEFARARFILGDSITHISISESEYDVFGAIMPRVYKVQFTSNKPPWNCPIICAYVKAHQKYNLFKQYNKCITYCPELVPIYIAIDGMEFEEQLDEKFDLGTNPGQWKCEEVKVLESPNRVIERDIPDVKFLADSPEWETPRVKASRLQFIKGSGGTGKTEHILKLGKACDSPPLYLAPTHDACQVLIERGISLDFDITEHTMTYHRAFGFGCNPFPKRHMYSTIILDECSMISAEDLKKILEALTGDQELILSGDFGQLNPVSGTPLYDHATEKYHEVFENFEITELTKNWRQKSDPEFFAICQSLRAPMSLESAQELIEKLNTRVVYGPDQVRGLAPSVDIHLCGVNTQVDAVNANYKFEVGAQVIMTKTLKGCANGQLGIIERLPGAKTIAIRFPTKTVEFKSANIESICKLAYAITIHKSQGKTIPGNVMINPTRIFTQNHLYVALTRATSLSKIFLTAPITMDTLIRSCRVNY